MPAHEIVTYGATHMITTTTSPTTFMIMITTADVTMTPYVARRDNRHARPLVQIGAALRVNP